MDRVNCECSEHLILVAELDSNKVYIRPMGKRKYKRIPKKDRRNQKLWAEGCRETILLPHVEKYADSMRFGWTAERDYFNRICNEYHTLIPWRLSDDEEPDLPLPVYDINTPPVEEELTAEEQVARGDHIRQKNKVCLFFLLTHCCGD